MFGEGVEIVPGMTVLHDDGLTYRVDKVVPSTDGYETAHRLSGLLRIAYTQMEDGGRAGRNSDNSSRLFHRPNNLRVRPPIIRLYKCSLR